MYLLFVLECVAVADEKPWEHDQTTEVAYAGVAAKMRSKGYPLITALKCYIKTRTLVQDFTYDTSDSEGSASDADAEETSAYTERCTELLTQLSPQFVINKVGACKLSRIACICCALN
jgi:hypothetical protein